VVVCVWHWCVVAVLLCSCLLGVCTTDFRIKLYRAPFCDYKAEWVEVCLVPTIDVLECMTLLHMDLSLTRLGTVFLWCPFYLDLSNMDSPVTLDLWDVDSWYVERNGATPDPCMFRVLGTSSAPGFHILFAWWISTVNWPGNKFTWLELFWINHKVGLALDAELLYSSNIIDQFPCCTGGRSFGAYLCILFREGVQGNRGVATRVDVVLTLSKSWEFNMARCPDTVQLQLFLPVLGLPSLISILSS